MPCPALLSWQADTLARRLDASTRFEMNMTRGRLWPGALKSGLFGSQAQDRWVLLGKEEKESHSQRFHVLCFASCTASR